MTDRCSPQAIRLALVLALAGLARALPAAEPPVTEQWSKLLSTDRSWTLRDRPGATEYAIPAALPEIARLPRDRRRRIESEVRRHDVNVKVMRRAFAEVRRAVESGALHADPEYRTELREVVIGIDRALAQPGRRALELHEPILGSLPAYTQIVVITPAASSGRVRAELQALGLEQRSRVIVDAEHPEKPTTTRWVRDVILPSRQGEKAVLATPFRYQPRRDLRWDDLRHVGALGTPYRTRVSTPLFFRAGNVMLGVAPDGRRILFIGEDEFRFARIAYDETIGDHPSAETMAGLLAAIVGADAIEWLPNSQHLFHLDMAMSMLDRGVAAMLDPLDAARLSDADRTVLVRVAAALGHNGFRVVAIPTLVERIRRYQSPVNIVPFRHRDTGRSMALLPVFPDVEVTVAAGHFSLNATIETRYRDAGIHPIPVEDRFNDLGGNTHCAVVALK
jgi:hypothetical protein